MGRLIGAIAILAIIIAAIGYYRGWFTVNVNQQQVQQDEKTLNQKLQKLESKTNDELHKASEGAK